MLPFGGETRPLPAFQKKENNIFFSLIYKHRRPPSSQRSQWMSMNLSMSTEKAATVAHPKHMALGPP